jgi:hypothetical protein
MRIYFGIECFTIHVINGVVDMTNIIGHTIE